jgi:hypothetical protein
MRGWIIPFWMWALWQYIKLTGTLVLILEVVSLCEGRVAPLYCWLLGLPGVYVVTRWTRFIARRIKAHEHR